MPDPAVRLDTTRLSAGPGGQASVVVTIRNMGQIVEGFTVQALGDPVAGWATVPDEIPVYPQQEATVVVIFSVPDGVGAASGVFPFGLIVRSVVDPDCSAVVEGDLEVTAVVGLQPVLRPVTSRGRWRGRHELRVTNWGNAPARLTLSASDPDERLAFLIHPEVLDVPLGGTARAKVLVRTRQPFLRGTATRLPFQVVADSGIPGSAAPTVPGGLDPRRTTVDGALNQVPILSKLVVTAALAAVVAVVAGVVYLVTHQSSTSTALDNSAALAAPKLAAAASGADQITLTWNAVDGVDGYNLVTVDATSKLPSGTQPIPKELRQFAVQKLPPASQHCFELQALRGKIQSTSEVVCATTGAATTTGSPSSTASGTPSTGSAGPGGTNPPGGPGPTDLIVELRVFPLAGSPTAEAQAKAMVASSNANGIQARYLLSSAYPQWKAAGASAPTPFQPSYVVYLGPFPTAAAAASAPCQRPPDDCVVFQPGPEAGG